MPKIAVMTSSCEKCPKSRYNTQGIYECAVVGQNILDPKQIAPFCPLPDYPAATIAGMEQTIVRQREPHRYGLLLAVLNHIAAKLKTNLSADGGGIKISCKYGGQDREVRFDVRCVTAFDVHGHGISFIDGDDTYRIFPDGNPPRLELLKVVDGKDLYAELAIC